MVDGPLQENADAKIVYIKQLYAFMEDLQHMTQSEWNQ